MKIQKGIFLFFSLLIAFTGLAEERITNPPQTNRWSLEACIQHAIEHNISIQRLQLQREEARIQENTSRNSRMPNLNIQGATEMSFGRTENLTGEFYQRNAMVTNANVQSVLPVFRGFRISNQVQHSRLEMLVADENLKKAKEDLSLYITSLFLQVLFLKELHHISEAQLALSKNQLERTLLLVRAGNVPESLLYDVEAQIAKDEVAIVDAKNNIELALLDLAQSLELERNTNFDIYAPHFEGDVIGQFMNSLLFTPDVIYQNALNIKPVIKGQEYRIESAQRMVRIAQAGYYPQLDFTIGVGTRYHQIYKPREWYNLITQEPIPVNPPFLTQIQNHTVQLVGIHFTIPVFNRFQVRNQVRSARVDILNQQLILEENKKDLFKEIQTAHKNATAAREKFRASERAVRSTNEAFEHARRRYELGSSSVFEFNESRTRMIQSRSELVQAKYEYILRTKILDFYNGIPIRL
ncbi:MAG: TolC family protein [Dysgonamonadaceae bacterium]|jgi:outer membrane protein|nr:TolC family protein [Dysgonamonadaceae bacterium]